MSLLEVILLEVLDDLEQYCLLGSFLAAMINS